MKNILVRGSLAVLSLAAVLGVSSKAEASVTGGFTVIAESDLGTARAYIPASALVHNQNDPNNWADDTYSWELDAPINLIDNDGDFIGRIESASTHYVADPIITMAFFAIAGAADTHFTVTSALLSFPGIPGAIGQVSVGTTLTDSNANGATMTGMYGDGNMYRAFYNGGAAGGTLFSSQIATFGAGASQTAVRSAVDGFRAVGATVSDMQAQFDFTVSATDLASGTARYEVLVPEPASIAVLAVGGLALLRRRNRK